MSERRMFSNRIANSARFLQMPIESQLLYFHMILRADDDGVVESYPVMKLLGVTPDNFKILVVKRFIEQLNEDQVIIIVDWLEHNKIRADRKKDSIYKHLIPKEMPLLEPKPRSDVKDNSNRIGGQSTDSVSKVSIGKVSIGKEERVLSYWNTLNIIKHKQLTKEMKVEISKALKEYDKPQLKQAMDTYATVLKGEQYFWNYKWGLYEFFKRGLVKFVDKTPEDYLIKGQGSEVLKLNS